MRLHWVIAHFAEQKPVDHPRRLGRKSSDEQRVDNCKVPLELRGPKPRPDDCVDDASTNSKR
jgi:hypothetical protein